MRSLPVLATLIVLSACVSAPRIVPAPPARQPIPAYVPPPPKPLANDWRDWPYTPGDWTYRREGRGSVASFGTASTAPSFAIRCDPAANTITMTRTGTATTTVPMTVRTSSTTRALATQPAGGMLSVTIDPRDTLLEAMGFSRGRFVIEQPGYPTLVLPSWAEIERVTEDCRR